jgi:hypothetical protein
MLILLGFLILVIFSIGAALMITRKLPALLTLPIMGFSIATAAWFIGSLPGSFGAVAFNQDVLGGVLGDGSKMLAGAMIAAFFGGMLSFILQKSGVAESMIKHGAELIGDNPLAVAFFTLILVALVFTTIGGLGAIIMVCMVVLPMLATVGVPPVVAGGIVLIGMSMGGVLNAQNWVIYIDTLGLPEKDVQTFALVLFVLMAYTGLVFVAFELMRAGAVRSKSRTLGIVAISGPVAAGLIYAMIALNPKGDAPLPMFTSAFQEKWTLGAADDDAPPEAEFSDTQVLVSFTPAPNSESGVPVASVLLSADRKSGWEGTELTQTLAQFKAEEVASMAFSVRANYTGTARLTLNFEDSDGASALNCTVALKPNKIAKIEVPYTALVEKGLGSLLSGKISTELASIEDGMGRPQIELFSARYRLVETTSLLKWIARGITTIGLLYVLWCIFADIKSRIRMWRRQVVKIQWYAYLIPFLPLVLIIIYDMPIVAAFLVGFVYAIFATLRPGSISMSVQSMIQGSSSVLPAVLLMVGIGILVRSVLGPSGWSAANGGMEWPVIASIKPLLNVVLPTGPVGFVLVFGICAPLALYRGPLNVWGLGFGIASLILEAGALPTAAIMSMLLTVGQVQGICDPTNTHNVWLANELRVDVQGLMFRTLPYIWAMVFAGLGISTFWYF